MPDINVTMPDVPAHGLDEKSFGIRFDLEARKFTQAIEERGYRLAWSRAASCPCAPVNSQTDQVDPNCTLCKGRGQTYFAPKGYTVPDAEVGALSDIQRTSILDPFYPGVVIKGIMSDLSVDKRPNDQLGNWVEGTASLTVRPENRLGYWDRIVSLDSTIVFTETIEAGLASALLPATYPILGVNLVRTKEKVYYGDADFTLQNGKIKWLAGKAPTKGARLAIHYLTFPVWLVVQHPKGSRETITKKKVDNPQTPLGNITSLPIRAVVKYEFLR